MACCDYSPRFARRQRAIGNRLICVLGTGILALSELITLALGFGFSEVQIFI